MSILTDILTQAKALRDAIEADAAKSDILPVAENFIKQLETQIESEAKTVEGQVDTDVETAKEDVKTDEDTAKADVDEVKENIEDEIKPDAAPADEGADVQKSSDLSA